MTYLRLWIVVVSIVGPLGGGCGDSEDGAGGSGPYATRVLDLRDFQTFQIEQSNLAAGNCPVPYLPSTAQIVALSDGNYRLTFTIAFESEEAFLECESNETDLDECELTEPLAGPPRTLSETDLAPLLDLFSAVPVNFEGREFCGIDDCNRPVVDWDELTVTGINCAVSGPWIDRDLIFQILDLVDDLRQVSE